jgi:hypothetical protein
LSEGSWHLSINKPSSVYPRVPTIPFLHIGLLAALALLTDGRAKVWADPHRSMRVAHQSFVQSFNFPNTEVDEYR